MKFCRFSYQGVQHWGVIEGERVQGMKGDMFSGEAKPDSQPIDLTDVELLCPISQPSKVIGIGLNYKEVAAAKGVDLPTDPVIFLKPPSSLIGPNANIIVPGMVKSPAFEVELAVIIGRRAKNVAAERALDYVFGYTLANDVTAKDHMIKGQPWARGKSFDTFTPLGPWIVPADTLNPDNIHLTALVNEQIKQDSNTCDMIFNVAQLVHILSKIMTLQPGDVILTGTPSGSCEICIGDRITLSSLDIGSITNEVIGE